MFHFPTFPPLALCVQARVTGHDSSWVSPFGHPRITARLPTPQGLSQAPTSFIGSWCQGIHHVPFIACLNNVKTTQLQKTSTPTPPHTHQPKQQASHMKSRAGDTHTYSRHQPIKPVTTDARVHYPDLKQQPHQPPTPTNRRTQDKGGPITPKNHTPHPSPRTRFTENPSPGWGCLILQDPTVCHHPRPPTRPRPRFHTHPVRASEETPTRG